MEVKPSVCDLEPLQKQILSRREWSYLGGSLAGGILLLALVWALTAPKAAPALPVAEVKRPAPDFTLPTLNGEKLQLSTYYSQSKIVLLNFWGTWCEPCKKETPALQAAYQQLQEQGLVIIGVNLTDNEKAQGNTEAKIQDFVTQFHVTYPIALDINGEIARAYQIYPIPTSYFIDSTGHIRYIRVGELTTEQVSALFKQLKQEKLSQVQSENKVVAPPR